MMRKWIILRPEEQYTEGASALFRSKKVKKQTHILVNGKWTVGRLFQIQKKFHNFKFQFNKERHICQGLQLLNYGKFTIMIILDQ